MVTYTRTPLIFTPAGNPIAFTLSGSNSNTLLYQAELLEANSGAVIYTGNIYPKPLTPSQASINLNNQISSLVRSDVDNEDGLAIPKTKPILGYKLKATEMGVTGGTIQALGSATTSNTFYAFEGQVDGFNFTSRFVGSTYVMKPGNVGKFLTLQPNNKAVNVYGLEQLYFIQSGYTGMVYTVTSTSGTLLHDELITASIPYLISAGTAEARAQANITITGTCAVDDNITVKINGTTLGSYTASSVSLPTTALAIYLNNVLSSNPSGYTIGVSGSTVSIQAPVGLGSSGNSLSLTTSFTSASTVNVITGETRATVSLGSYTRIPTIFELVRVQVEDPTYGTYYIFENPVDFSLYTPDLDGFTSCLVDLINSNIPDNLGYMAGKTGSDTFSLTARTGTGTLMNGTEAWIIFEDYAEAYDGIWSGGVTSGYSAQTTYHSIIPHSKTSFTGGVTRTYDLSGFTMPNMIRLNVSPKKYIAYGINDFETIKDYNILLKDTSGNTISEIKTYRYHDTECNIEFVNILWANSIGGVDSYQFLNPQESLNVERNKISKNNINLDSYTPYLTDGIYNPIESTISVHAKSGFKVYTRVLADDESAWLTELVKSKNIYVELTDGSLVPLQLVNTNYDIRKQKYSRNELNQYQFEFSFSDEFLPAMASAGIIING